MCSYTFVWLFICLVIHGHIPVNFPVFLFVALNVEFWLQFVTYGTNMVQRDSQSTIGNMTMLVIDNQALGPE